MTQQEYENKIKELEKQIEELKMAKVEEPKRWKPNENERYHTIDDSGDDCDLIWDNDRYDNWRYLTGNCFKTKEEAEEYKKQIEYTARYKNYIEEHSELIDWDNDNQYKYYAYFLIGRRFEVASVSRCKSQGAIYSSSEQIILDAIKEIGEDNFKKYVLGVK